MFWFSIPSLKMTLYISPFRLRRYLDDTCIDLNHGIDVPGLHEEVEAYKAVLAHGASVEE